MNNKEFREEVYKKYEYYKKYKNPKKNSFYYKQQYKETSGKKLFLNYAATFIIATIIISGIAYATTQYIKNTENKKIWKEPEKYNYEEEKKVTEEDVKKSISEEEAKEIGLETLRKLDIDIGNITESHLSKLPWINKISWMIKTDKEFSIEINAQNGKIESFSNDGIFMQTRISKTEEEATEVAKEISKEICQALSFDRNYELAYIYSMGRGQWSADFSAEYDGIFNDYQTIRFIFFPSTKEIALLRIFDYDFENNPFEITEEQAIEIAKKEHGEDKIKEISIEKDIKQMNTMVYLKYNQPESGESYRTEGIVRNVWNVRVIEKEYGYKEEYYIDATTGEIIGGSGGNKTMRDETI